MTIKALQETANIVDLEAARKRSKNIVCGMAGDASTNISCIDRSLSTMCGFLISRPFPNVSQLQLPVRHTHLKIPRYSCVVPAGFPSPADDHLDGKIDFNEHLVEDESATFVARASGDSMVGEGIHDGDQLVVQFGQEPKHGDIVIAIVNGEHFCKKLRKQGTRVFLDSANPDYQPVELQEGDELSICGVVKFAIHRF